MQTFLHKDQLFADYEWYRSMRATQPVFYDEQRHCFCLGAPLARLEAKIALTTMLERFPGQWRVPDVPLEPIQSGIIFGMKRLPMTWGE